jgi:hypothetical protein
MGITISHRMREVAIVGAGELGGLVAHALARRNSAGVIRLIDDSSRVAEGKALDISQAAPQASPLRSPVRPACQRRRARMSSSSRIAQEAWKP